MTGRRRAGAHRAPRQATIVPRMTALLASLRPRLRGQTIWWLTGSLAAAGAATQILWVPTTPVAGAPFALPWWILAFGFLLSSVFVVHLPVRRDAHTLSLSEVLLVVGMALASPAQLLIGRLAGSALALTLHRRQRPTKLAFNLSLAYLETSAAIAVYRWFLRDSSPAVPRGWSALMGAVAISLIVSLGLVTLVIAMHDRRRTISEVLSSLVMGGVVSLGAGLFGVVYTIMLWTDPRSVVIVAVLTPLIYGAVSSFSGLSKQHSDLQAVFGFAREIHRPLLPDEVITTTLVQVRDTLRAEIADLVMFRDAADDTADRVWIDANGTMRHATLDKSAARDLARQVLSNPLDRSFTAGTERFRLHYRAIGADNGIVAPVSGPEGITAILAAGNRLGPVQTFDTDDVRLLEVLAKQFSDTMGRSRLVEALKEEAAERERQAAGLVRAKDEFLASVAHELRTPLTAVHVGAELLRDQHDQLDRSGVLELVEYIAGESGELAHIIEDLLIATRADIGSLTVKPEPMSVAAEVDTALQSLRDVAGVERIRLGVASGRALADPLRFRQIVRNLVSNALRYGGPDIEISATGRAEGWQVIVSDDGDGVPESAVEAIFDPYQRSHDLKGVTESVGLGLAVARRLAEAMDGSLTYRRRLGRTEFVVTLPDAPQHLRIVSDDMVDVAS